MAGRTMKGRWGGLRVETTTIIPQDDPLVVEVRRCADALEKLAEAFTPEREAARAAFKTGTPVPD